MKKIALALTLATLAGCSTATRFFAIAETASAGFDSGIKGRVEQRAKYGPVMALVGGSYSQATKSGAEDGYQWGADVAGRFYLGPWFGGVGYYWSGYKVKFDDGRKWSKDGRNIMFMAGWEQGPWEIRFTGSPEESQSPNRVSWIGADAEWKFYEPWIITAGAHRIEFDQGESRESDWSQSLGLGLEF